MRATRFGRTPFMTTGMRVMERTGAPDLGYNGEEYLPICLSVAIAQLHFSEKNRSGSHQFRNTKAKQFSNRAKCD
jgi:hypothetical protein